MAPFAKLAVARLERGKQRGLSIRRLAAILDALKVGDVVFERPPTVTQTSLEIMLYGDRWVDAAKAADRRLAWREAHAAETAAEPAAWFEDAG